MAFAILRTAKLKTAGNCGGLNAHLTRTMDVPNADPELRPYNQRLIGSQDLVKDIEARLYQAGIKEVRKNGVMAVEHLITASPEAFGYHKVKGEDGKPKLMGDVNKWKAFEKKSMEWLIERYGKENIVNFTVHKDEKTPHIHAVVTPIQKTDKGNKLNCRHFLGGREKMREMQTSFSEKVKDLSLQRGIEGSKAKHQSIKQFYSQINEVEVKLELKPPSIEVQQPEKRLIGFKEDPIELAQKETNRINTILSEYTKEAQKAIQVASGQRALGNILKNENKGLKVTLEGLEREKNKIKAEREKLKAELKDVRDKHVEMLKAIAMGKVTPEQVKQLFEKQVDMNKEKKQGRGM